MTHTPRRSFWKTSTRIACAIALAALSACKPALLPGTSIEDTPDNREVLAFMEQYRTAVESRSAENVLKLVASDYWEDSGTPDQRDDYGIEKLQRDLAERLSHTRAIHLELRIQHVEPDDASLRVDYRYLQRALLAMPAGEQWVSHSDVNRIVLRRKSTAEGSAFEIVAGL